jgi:hypothetical protein
VPAGVVTFSTPVGHWISVVAPVLICLRRCHTTAGDGQAAAIVAALVAAVSVRVAALAVVGLASVVAVAAVCVFMCAPSRPLLFVVCWFTLFHNLLSMLLLSLHPYVLSLVFSLL